MGRMKEGQRMKRREPYGAFISEDYSQHANLPKEPMFKEAPMTRSINHGYDDTYEGIDRCIDDSVSQINSQMRRGY